MSERADMQTYLEQGRDLWLRICRKYLGMRPQITAVDVDGETLRVVQTVHRKGATRVNFFATCRLEFMADENPDDPAKFGQVVSRTMRQLKIKPGLVVMGVPRAMAVLRTLQVPATEDVREIASMVHYQVAKDLPFSIQDAVIDFKVQGPAAAAKPEPPAGKTSESAEKKESGTAMQSRLSVLVAAVKREHLEAYRSSTRAAGLRLAALGLRSYAHARCVQACNLIRPDESVALISLRPDEVIIDVLRDQSLAFSRVAPVKQPHSDEDEEAEAVATSGASARQAGSQNTEQDEETEAAGFASAVTIEVVRSLHSYESTAGSKSVRHVVVAGSTGHELKVVEALRQRLSIECELLDPAAALGLPESQRQHAPGALAAFGLGLGVNDPAGLPFDFLHPKKPAPPPLSRRTKGLAAAAAASVVLIALLAVLHRVKQNRLAEQQTVLAQLTQEKQQRPLYQQTVAQYKVVRDWVNEEISWLDYLAHLSTNLPPREEVYLNSISTSARDTVRLSVQARSGEVLAKLDRQLRAAGYDVKPLAINPAPDRYGYGFKSNVEAALPKNLAPAPQGEKEAASPGKPSS
jgi:Tfp pilus assembly PilM family ATPase